MTAAKWPALSLGFEVVEWMEANLVHGPGDIHGAPYALTPDHARFLIWAYALRPDGRRQFRRCVLSRGKGFAKSELAAAIMAAELCGPVRFDRFDKDGWPIGQRVNDPLIPCAAASEDQAEETLYAKFRAMVDPLVQAGRLDVGLERTFTTDRPGAVKLVSSSNVSRDGALPTFTPCDETHLWSSRELKMLHATLRRNLAKRVQADPWLLETTTAYMPGEESVAEGSHDYGKKVASGEVTDPSLYFDHAAASTRWNLSDPDELRKAILEARGSAAAYTNVGAIIDEYHDPQTEESDFRRFWLNQVVRGSSQWLAPAAWDAAARRDLVVAAGDQVALGFDGSRLHDATALVGCRLADGHLFMLGAWERPEGPRGDAWEVPGSEVDAAVANAFERYDVSRFYCDPPFWQQEVERWALEFGSAVVAWWTNRETQTAHALERLHTAVLTGQATHDGNALLARHVANARRRIVRAGVVIAKETRNSTKKIDAAMAATLAFEARSDAIADGALAPRRSRIPVSL